MKKSMFARPAFLLFMAGLFLTSCVKYKHDDIPDHGDAFVPRNAKIMSVEELKGRYPGDFDSVTQFRQGDSLLDVYIHVVVIGNDVSGNIYKSMYVRDISQAGKTGLALNIAVDKTGLYNFYPTGQELYIKCTGLYFGKYQNLPQLGFRYADDNGIVGLGRIPDVVFTQHVFKTGLPPVDEAAMPQPIEITDVSQLEDPSLYNQLVLLRDVQFAGDEVGQEFAPAPPAGTNPTSTNRYFTVGGEGSGLALRTSSACRFFRQPVPAGIGDMVCIYAVYGTSKQFYLRSYSDMDLEKFAATGDKDYPVFYASFSTDLSDFKVVSTLGDARWTWGKYGDGCAMIQGSRDYEPNEDWLISREIEIPERFNSVDFSFEQALSYKYDQPDSYYTVRVSTNYDPALHRNPREADWDILDIPSPHPGNSFTFMPSGNIDMRAMKGRKFRIAFVYKSDKSGMATWEINKVKIIGNE